MTRLIKKQRVIIIDDGISTAHSVIRTVRVIKESNYLGRKGGYAKINNEQYLVEQKEAGQAWYGEL